MERGYVTEEYLKRDHPHLSLQPVETTAQALHALATGEVDAYVGNLTLGSYLIDKLGLATSRHLPHTLRKRSGHRCAQGLARTARNHGQALATIDEAERQKIRQQSLAIRYRSRWTTPCCGRWWRSGSFCFCSRCCGWPGAEPEDQLWRRPSGPGQPLQVLLSRQHEP